MTRTLTRIALTFIIAAGLAACSKQTSYPTSFDVPGLGKADGTPTPVTDKCAGDVALVSMSAEDCAPVDPDSPAAAPAHCSVAPRCFPRATSGQLGAFPDGPFGLSRIDAPFYWFRGGDKPYLLSVRLESVTYQNSMVGRGQIKLEVRVFENGRNIDPEHQAPIYASADDGFSRVINPNDTVVLIPVPDADWFLGVGGEVNYQTGARMVDYKLTFSRQVIEAEPEYAMEAAKADLYIESFNVRTVAGDETVNFEVKACNGGGSVDLDQVEDVKVKVYTNAAARPECGAETPHAEAVGGWFWEGGLYCRTYSFQQKLEQGPYTAWAVIDGDCKLDELTEESNAASMPYQVVVDDRPEVQARLAVTMYKALVEDNTVHFKAMVCNNGATASRPSTLRVWQHLEGTPTAESGYHAHEWQVPQLQPMWKLDGTANTGAQHCTEVLTAKQDSVARGTFTARWLLISDDAVANNDVFVRYTIDQDPAPAATDPEPAATDPEPAATDPEPAATDPEPAATDPEPAATDPEPAATDPEPAATDPEPAPAAEPMADLHIKDLTVEVINDLAAFTVTVCNKNDTVATFELGLFLDVAEPRCGTGIKPETTWQITALAKDCVTKGVTHAIKTSGKFTASALADHKCGVEEDDEDNNRKSHDYEVKLETEPDPAASADPAAGTTTPGAGTTTPGTGTTPGAGTTPSATTPSTGTTTPAAGTTPGAGTTPNNNGYYPNTPTPAVNQGGCSTSGTPVDGSLGGLLGLVLLALMRRGRR